MAKYPFTYNQEIGHQGQSLVPHFPGGLSGVTIGPGYDMGSRSPQEIYQDLTRAGVPAATAELFMEAAYKTGDEAQAWVAAHRHELSINEVQQATLFDEVLVPEYERRMRSQLELLAHQNDGISHDMIVWENLSEKQKHILFDFTYNPGLTKFPTLTEAVLRQDWDTVYESYQRFSAGQPLSYRNDSFYYTFLDPNAPPIESIPIEVAEVLPETAELITDLWSDTLYEAPPSVEEILDTPLLPDSPSSELESDDWANAL
ncbi:MAG: pesticin C-terminus-like muramidase [Runella sp.]